MSYSEAQEPKFSVALRTDKYQKLINDTLKDTSRAMNFVASISSAVASNPQLSSCDAGTVLAAGLLAESLQLSLSPQLGYCYIVPFKDNVNKRTTATFVLGWRGYWQLAMRSGQYKYLNVIPFKKGEVIHFDVITEQLKYKLIEDEVKREIAETAGYYAVFELHNGFRKALYWTKEKMESHALRYSKAYAYDKRSGTKSSFWSKDYDMMASKTMLRQLIGKYGIMSIEMQNAVNADTSVLNIDGSEPRYVEASDLAEAISASNNVPVDISASSESYEIDATTGEVVSELSFESEPEPKSKSKRNSKSPETEDDAPDVEEGEQVSFTEL
jgi:recombination protein RecT